MRADNMNKYKRDKFSNHVAKLWNRHEVYIEVIFEEYKQSLQVISNSTTITDINISTNNNFDGDNDSRNMSQDMSHECTTQDIQSHDTDESLNELDEKFHDPNNYVIQEENQIKVRNVTKHELIRREDSNRISIIENWIISPTLPDKSVRKIDNSFYVEDFNVSSPSFAKVVSILSKPVEINILGKEDIRQTIDMILESSTFYLRLSDLSNEILIHKLSGASALTSTTNSVIDISKALSPSLSRMKMIPKSTETNTTDEVRDKSNEKNLLIDRKASRLSNDKRNGRTASPKPVRLNLTPKPLRNPVR
jgi:hypothetical protein